MPVAIWNWSFLRCESGGTSGARGSPEHRDPRIGEQSERSWCLFEEMTRQERHRLTFILSSLLMVGCLAIWILHWNSKEFAVYEATIREAFSGEDVSHYVILDTTEAAGRFGISNF